MAIRKILAKQAEVDNQRSAEESRLSDERPAKDQEATMSRREILKAAAGAVVAAPIVGLAKTQAAPLTLDGGGSANKDDKAPRFFTPQEFALVDELTELIIPADDHSPGARAALVAMYIDARLAESFTDEPRQAWRNGLKQIETLSNEMHGRGFLQATPEQRIELLKRIAQNEGSPKSPEEIFFGELKGSTVRGYYTSKIGIHNELEYKGNTYQKEYAGYDAK